MTAPNSKPDLVSFKRSSLEIVDSFIDGLSPWSPIFDFDIREDMPTCIIVSSPFRRHARTHLFPTINVIRTGPSIIGISQKNSLNAFLCGCVYQRRLSPRWLSTCTFLIFTSTSRLTGMPVDGLCWLQEDCNHINLQRFASQDDPRYLRQRCSRREWWGLAKSTNILG